MQELFDLWKATTPDANISGDFSPKEFAAAPHLKSGKAPGPDSICLELLIHAGLSLKFWLCGFLSFQLAPTQNSKSLEKDTGSCDPLALKTCGGATELPSHLSALRSLQDP